MLRNKNGFTLVELIVVIAILCILGAMCLPYILRLFGLVLVV